MLMLCNILINKEPVQVTICLRRAPSFGHPRLNTRLTPSKTLIRKLAASPGGNQCQEL